jgi:hypothetical protein
VDHHAVDLPGLDIGQETLQGRSVEVAAAVTAVVVAGGNAGPAGFVPGIGSVASGIDAGLYLAEGDYANAALSGVGMIPGGVIAKGAAKVVKGAAKGAKAIAGTAKAARVARAAAKGAQAIRRGAQVARGAAQALRGVGGKVVCILTGSCFAPGTPLLTPTGHKAIEQFRPGDWLLSAPEADPEAVPEPRQVEEVFTTEAHLVTVCVRGRAVHTTDEHPFWVFGKGWTAAKDLQPGDEFRSHDGERVGVDAVRETGATATVYNLRIADYHTYFFGSLDWGFSVWAHNACVYEVLKNGIRRYVGVANRGLGGTIRQRLRSALRGCLHWPFCVRN